MGQVPEKKHLYGIVGNGRVAKHFINYFSLLNLPFIQWKRGDEKSVEEALDGCTVILLLISDGVIKHFIGEHPQLSEKILVHFSGSLSVPGILSFHPLISFTKDLYDLETYKRIPVIYEKGNGKFLDIFPNLPNPRFELDSKDKKLYHALCVLAGNFTTILWQKMFSEFENRFDIKREMIFPYMERIFKNLQGNSADALTGPLVRKDVATIRENVDALEGDPFQDVYKAFLKAYGLEN